MGTLPNLAHGVSGELYIINSRDAVITNFNYDGRGPGTASYSYHACMTNAIVLQLYRDTLRCNVQVEQDFTYYSPSGAYMYFFGTEYAPRDPDEHGGGQKMPVYGGNE